MAIKLLNFLVFQVGWLFTVLLGASHYHWLAPLVSLLTVALHLYQSPQAGQELRLVLLALAIGLLWENLMTLTGVVVYTHGQWFGSFAPLWIVAMWASLATTLNLSLRWLHGRPTLALLLGALGGPLAFLAGERLGAVSFPDPMTAMLVLAMGWALLFDLLFRLARHYDGFRYLDAEAGRVSA